MEYGGRPCLDPMPIAAACSAQGLPTDWIGRPNGYRCSRGTDYGEAWLLMRKGDLDQVDLNKLHDLVMEDPQGRRITFRDLLFHRARAVTPGAPDDEDTPYLVHAVDVRWLAKNPYYASPISKHYNVWERRELPGYGLPYFENYQLYTGNHTSGVTQPTFTWQAMLDSVWRYIAVPEWGPSPKLPFAPDVIPTTVNSAGQTVSSIPGGFIYPTSFMFDAIPAADAYAIICRRLDIALAFDPTRPNKPKLVEIGKTDKAFDDASTRWAKDGLLIFDSRVTEGTRAKIPEKVAILRVGNSTYFAGRTFSDPAHPPIPGSQFYDIDQGVILKIDDEDIADEFVLLHQQDELYWHAPIVSKKSVPDPDKPRKGTQRGTRGMLWDDYPAFVGEHNQGTGDPTINAKLRDQRNAERAAAYFRQLKAEPFHRIYGGLVADFLPGQQVGMTSWYDRGRGYRTEIASVWEPIPRSDWEHYGTIDMVRTNLFSADLQSIGVNWYGDWVG